MLASTLLKKIYFLLYFLLYLFSVKVSCTISNMFPKKPYLLILVKLWLLYVGFLAFDTVDATMQLDRHRQHTVGSALFMN